MIIKKLPNQLLIDQANNLLSLLKNYEKNNLLPLAQLEKAYREFSYTFGIEIVNNEITFPKDGEKIIFDYDEKFHSILRELDLQNSTIHIKNECPHKFNQYYLCCLAFLTNRLFNDWNSFEFDE